MSLETQLPIIRRIADDPYTQYEGIKEYASLSARPAASAFGSGLCLIAGVLYISDGVSWASVPNIKSDYGIELGSLSVAGTPYFDFHSSGNNIDYDSRIIASGGSGSVGQGTLTYTAAKHIFNGGIYDNTSVKFYGAVGDGTTVENTAFNNAAQNAPAGVPMKYENVALSTPMADVVCVYVPSGSYNLTAQVDPGGREVIWILDPGASIVGYNENYLGGIVVRNWERVNSYSHYGTRDYACGFSVIANTGLRSPAQVMGFDGPSHLSAYSGRDSVGLFAENHSPTLVATLTAPNYTATTVTCPTPVDVKKLRKGMIVDTAHATKYSGMISGWAADGTSITVTAWYIVDGSRTAGTPANGVDAYVNAVTKVWAHNANVFLDSGCFASAATGFELGVLNNKAAPGAAGANPKLWGFDCVNLGTYKCESAFVARGSFFHGFESQGSDFGLYCNNNTVAIKTFAAGTIFVSYNGSNERLFSINSDGSLELGNLSAANTPFIDFHSSGNNIDYDCRIIATGGSGSVGQGSLNYTAAAHAFNSPINTPQGGVKVDNVVTSSLKWVDVTVAASALDGAGAVNVIAGVSGDAYKIRDIILVGGGTNFGAGGDRNISLTDGTTTWTTIANADIETAPTNSLRWGDAKVPLLGSTSNTQSVTGQAIRFSYSGGATDHGGTGSLKFSVCIEKTL